MSTVNASHVGAHVPDLAASSSGSDAPGAVSSRLGRVLLRPEEVAEALGVGRTAVYELLRTGDLRSVKIGKSRRIPTEAVGELVARLEAREGAGSGAA